MPIGSYDTNVPWAQNVTNLGTRGVLDFLRTDPSSLYGSQTGYLTGQLKNTIEGGLDPALMQLLGIGRNNISRLGDTARRQTEQQFASSGFRGSGTNTMNDIFGTQTNALEGLNADIGQLSMQNRQRAIISLLGLNSEQSSINANLASGKGQAGLGLLGAGQQSIQLGEQMANQPSGFGQMMGSLGSAAITALPGLIALSDKKTKENIKYTGEKTNDGIPIAEFNYKGNPQRFRGVIAQDVEKKRPSAVVKAVDYSKL